MNYGDEILGGHFPHAPLDAGNEGERTGVQEKVSPHFSGILAAAEPWRSPRPPSTLLTFLLHVSHSAALTPQEALLLDELIVGLLLRQLFGINSFPILQSGSQYCFLGYFNRVHILDSCLASSES